MKNYFSSKTQQGFTLVELMIAVTISLVLLLVIGTTFVSTRQAFRVQEDNARIQESGRFALEILGRSIKQAGHADIPFLSLMEQRLMGQTVPQVWQIHSPYNMTAHLMIGIVKVIQ